MNQQHPIEGLMRTALENIRDMVDVSTVIGEPIDGGSGLMMIPICKVSCGFVAGGSEFLPSGVTLRQDARVGADPGEERPVLPFGGGSGAGVGVSDVYKRQDLPLGLTSGKSWPANEAGHYPGGIFGAGICFLNRRSDLDRRHALMLLYEDKSLISSEVR